MSDLRRAKLRYGVDEYIRRGNEGGLLDSKSYAAMLADSGDKTVVFVASGSRRIATHTGGLCVRCKHSTKILKSYGSDTPVDFSGQASRNNKPM